MRLILMRHAKALQRAPHIYPDDSLRPLSEIGLQEHEQISKVLKDMAIRFDEIITSPFERAKQTAKITKKVYGLKKKTKKWDELADRFTVDDLLKRLKDKDQDSTILLVGHEPSMSVLANALLRTEGNIDIDFKKSGVMCISFFGHPKRGEGSLEYFLKPKLLKALSKPGDQSAKKSKKD